MTTTDTDALDPHDSFARNLVANAVMDAHDGWVPLSLRYRIAEKALEALAPIVAVEVRKAKAEALRELSAHISEVVDNAKPWQAFTEHVLHEAGACDYLDRAAAEHETRRSDDHR